MAVNTMLSGISCCPFLSDAGATFAARGKVLV
jgi:hypothetical protein